MLTDLDRAEKGEQVVLYMDPMHQIHNNENGYAWQRKGKVGTKQVRANTGRRRLNIIGAMNPISCIPTTIVTEDNCNVEVIKVFLHEVKKEYIHTQSITVYLDNARYQRAYEVQEEAIKLGIILKYLPPYSPNLNLIERFWKFTKKKLFKNHYYSTFEEFYDAIIEYFQYPEKYTEELKTLLTRKFEIIRAS